MTVDWGLPIVANYFFGGVSAGAFITYYLSQGLGMSAFRPLAKLGWISAVVFGILTPLPVFAHLGQAGRWPSLITGAHWASPMAWAGPILLMYLVMVLLNGRFFFYESVVLAHRSARGVRRAALRLLLITRPPEGEIPRPSRVLTHGTAALAFIGAIFFAYPGFELGILQSRPLWANPFNPVMFLLTGLISGMAFVVLLWLVLRPEPASPEGPKFARNLLLPALVTLFLALNASAYLTLSYASPEVQAAVGVLATGELSGLFIWVGLVLGAAIPAILLTTNAVLPRSQGLLLGAGSFLLLVGTFAQKYAFVAGGQILEPSGTTSLSPWPTSGEWIEFAALLALGYFLFQLALWVSPWRQPERFVPPAPPEEVAA